MCLEILVGYGVGPKSIWLLRSYWGRIKNVAESGGYCGLMFKVYCSVTQGYPLSPIIFNMVIDFIIQHWVMVVAATVEGAEGLGASVQ